MYTPRPYNPLYADQIVDIALRRGLDRAELATELGVNEKDFAAWEEAHPEFATALADAQSRCQTWWQSQPRLAMNSNTPFRVTIWAKAYALRFGRSPNAPQKSAEARTRGKAVKVRYEIPDNGKERRYLPGREPV